MLPISAVTRSLSPPSRVVNVAFSNLRLEIDSTLVPEVAFTLADVPNVVFEPKES